MKIKFKEGLKTLTSGLLIQKDLWLCLALYTACSLSSKRRV